MVAVEVSGSDIVEGLLSLDQEEIISIINELWFDGEELFDIIKKQDEKGTDVMKELYELLKKEIE